MITMKDEVYQAVSGDLDEITRCMTELYIACGNGDLRRVAAYVVDRVGKVVDCIKDTLTDCEVKASAKLTMAVHPDLSVTLDEVNARRGF